MNTDLEQARRFLEAIFVGVPGLIEVRVIKVDGGARAVFCNDLEQAMQAVARATTLADNIYVGVATRRTSASGAKQNLGALGAFWVDIDFKDDPLGERETLDVKLESFPLPPSLRVWSGGGVHLYWVLRDPVEVSTSKLIARVELILKGLADALGGDRSVTDASRVLRVPGTINYPDARKRERGRVPAECRLT